MPINEQYQPISAIGNGVTAQFVAVPDSWFPQSTVIVTHESTQIPFDQVAGGISLTQAIPNGEAFTVTRETSLTQNRDFQTSGRMPSEEVVGEMDRQVLIDQECRDEIIRAPKAAPGDTPPSGSLKRAPTTSQGQDENGELVARTPQEEVDFLGIQPDLDAAIASGSQASASAVSASQSALAAERARDSVLGFLNNKKAAVFSSNGQSNEANNEADVTAYGDNDLPLPNMYQFSRGAIKNYYDAKGYGQFIPAYQTLQYPDSVTWFTPDSMEVGSAFYFAYAYALENPDTDVYLVCNAVGATGFGDNKWGRGDSLLKRSILEAKEVLRILRKTYESVVYGGIKMHQGEDDIGLANYADQFYDAFEYAREEMGEGDFPIVVGTMLESYVTGSPAREAIDAVHRDIANHVNNATFANLDGLTDEGVGDNLHFGPDAVRDSGPIYYEAWKTLTLESEAQPIFEVYVDGSDQVVSPLKVWNDTSIIPPVFTGFMQFTSHRIRFDDVLPVGPFSKVIVAQINNSTNANLMSHHLTESSGLIFSTNSDGANNKLAASDNNLSWPPPSGESVRGATTIDTSDVHVYALTYDGQKLRLYIDGVLDGEGDELDGPDVLLVNVSIGEYRGGNYLNANVYYSGLFEGVVSASKLADIRNTYVPDMPDPQPLTIQNRFDLTDATDSVGTGALTIITGAFDFQTDTGVDYLQFTNSSFNTGLSIGGSTTKVVRYRSTSPTGNLISGAGNNSLPLFFNSGNLTFGNVTTGKIIIPTAGTDWLDGNWHTISASWDSMTEQTRVAVDGVVVGTGSQIISLGANIYLGSFNSSSLYFNGGMDFAELYSGAATESELIALSQKTTTT